MLRARCRTARTSTAWPASTNISGATRERFARAFTEKLLLYAIGRNVQYYFASAVRAIVRDAANDGYAFASLVNDIVRSAPLQMRNAQPGEQVAQLAEGKP